MFTGLDHSEYEVSMTWVAGERHSDDACVKIYDGTADTLVKAYDIDQTKPPRGDLSYDGKPFQILDDNIEIRNGAMIVIVNGDHGVLVADAVRLSCPGDKSAD